MLAMVVIRGRDISVLYYLFLPWFKNSRVYKDIGKLWNWYHKTIGSHKYQDALVNMLVSVIFV